MPILGLTSGKQIKISQKQYEAFMKRREAYIGGVLIEMYDDNKKTIGKIKTDCIEFVAPDNSPWFAEPKPVVHVPEPRKEPVISYKKSYDKKEYDKKKH